MATDPSQFLVGLVGTTGLGQAAVDSGINSAQQQAAQQQQLSYNQFAMSQAQQQAQQQQQAAQQFNQDVLAYNQDPTPQKLSSLAIRYPQQAQNFATAAKLKDDAQRNADLGFYGGIYNAAQNGRTDLVTSQLQQRRDAEKAAGNDTAELDDTLAQLQSGDQAGALKGVKGLALSQIYAHDPANFAKAFGLGDDGNAEGKVVGNSIGHYEGNRFVVDYRDAGKPEYRTVRNPDGSESIVQVGGGDPASTATGAAGGSGSPGGRTTGGWTPRQRNGGDNSDAAVDAKIAGVTKALGRGPDDSLSGLNPRQIAQALTLSEGGAGSLADRNNNPANLRNGDGSYKKFPTKEAGLSAAAALVQRKLSQGLNTPRLIIEGRPVGSSPSSNGGSGQVVYTSSNGQATGDPNSTGQAFLSSLPAGRAQLLQSIAEGRAPAPKPGSRFGEALSEDLARAYPGVDATQFAARQQARKDFSGNGKAAQNVSALNRFYGHLNDAYELHLKLGGPNLGPLSGVAASVSQAFDPKTVNDYNTAIEGLQGEFQKLTKNGQGNESEAARLIHNAQAAQSSQGRLGALQALAKLAAAQVQPLHDQWRAAFNDGTKIPIDISPASRAVYQNVVGAGSHALPIDRNGAVISPPPRTAVQYLRQNPRLRAQFDQKYGRGAASWALAQ